MNQTELNPVIVHDEPGEFKLSPSSQRWRSLTRMAHMIYEGGPITSVYNTPGKVLLAVDLADRLNVAVVNVMQNFEIDSDGAYWKGAGMIALVNASNIFKSRLLFEEVGNPDDENYKVRAYAIDKSDEKVFGPWVSTKMSILADWNKPFDVAAPQIALSYRAANFFVRLTCPEVTQGIVGDIDRPAQPNSASGAVAKAIRPDASVSAAAQATDPGNQTLTPMAFKVGAAVEPAAAPAAPATSAKATAAIADPDASIKAPESVKRPYVRKAVAVVLPDAKPLETDAAAQTAVTATAP